MAPASTVQCGGVTDQFTRRADNGTGPAGVWMAPSGLFVTDYGFNGGAGRILRFADPSSGACPSGAAITDSSNTVLTGFGPESVALSADELYLFVAWTEQDRLPKPGFGRLDIYKGVNPLPLGGYANYDLNVRFTAALGVDLSFPRGVAFDDADQLLFLGDDTNNRIVIFSVAGGIWTDIDSVVVGINDPKAVAFQNGQLLVANFAGTVLRFDGPFPGPAYVPAATVAVAQPVDVAWNNDGTFFVSSIGGGVGLNLDFGGVVLATYDGFFNDPANGAQPLGVAFQAGTVFVADAQGARVLIY